MRQEVDRCRRALELHRQGRRVAVVSSGDAGVYGMAGLLMELDPEADVQVVPGITAAQAAAARLGAPLMNDFAVLSLSDLLTPRDEVLRRADGRRRRRPGDVSVQSHLAQAPPALRAGGGPLPRSTARRRRPRAGCATPTATARRSAVAPWATCSRRPSTCGPPCSIGCSRTEVLGGRMVTRRGYAEKYGAEATPTARTDGPSDRRRRDGSVTTRRHLYVLGGTGFARQPGRRPRGGRLRRPAVGRDAVWAPMRSSATRPRPGSSSGGLQVGRLTPEALVDELRSLARRALVDATHPYAVEVSRPPRRGGRPRRAPAAAGRAARLVPGGRRRAPTRTAGSRVRFFASADELAAALLDRGRAPLLHRGRQGPRRLRRPGAGPRRPGAPHRGIGGRRPRRRASAPADSIAAYPPYTTEFTVACLRHLQLRRHRQQGVRPRGRPGREAGGRRLAGGRALRARPSRRRAIRPPTSTTTLATLLDALEDLWNRS